MKSTATNHTVEINKQVNCQTKNILYCITCERCSVQYIGETGRSLQDRFSEHKGYAINKKTNARDKKFVRAFTARTRVCVHGSLRKKFGD